MSKLEYIEKFSNDISEIISNLLDGEEEKIAFVLILAHPDNEEKKLATTLSSNLPKGYSPFALIDMIIEAEKKKLEGKKKEKV